MNVSLDNPYGDVIIPRAKLRPPADDGSTVIVNAMALESAYATAGDGGGGAGETKDGQPSQSPPAYNGQTSYTLKEDAEEVGRCRACCLRCRRQK